MAIVVHFGRVILVITTTTITVTTITVTVTTVTVTITTPSIKQSTNQQKRGTSYEGEAIVGSVFGGIPGHEAEEVRLGVARLDPVRLSVVSVAALAPPLLLGLAAVFLITVFPLLRFVAAAVAAVFLLLVGRSVERQEAPPGRDGGELVQPERGVVVRVGRREGEYLRLEVRHGRAHPRDGPDRLAHTHALREPVQSVGHGRVVALPGGKRTVRTKRRKKKKKKKRT